MVRCMICLAAGLLPALVVLAQPSSVVRLSVVDASGAAVGNAVVEVRSASGALLSVLRTEPTGEAALPNPLPAIVQVRVTSAQFTAREMIVFTGDHRQPVAITLEPASVYSRIAVNASRGGAEEALQSPHVAVVVDRTDVSRRPGATLGNFLEHQPGVLVQQSTYAQVSPTLRGLTGYHVLNLIDGIRFNNSTFRSGPNQYLAFVEPLQPERMEVSLGPTAAQYGSDSLGGTLQLETAAARFAPPGQWDTHGDFILSAASADLSGQGAVRLSVSRESVFWLAGASGRALNDLRAGGGLDSRNVFHRYFGMPLADVRELLGARQQETGFRQYGLQTKLAVRAARQQYVTLYYQRGAQENVKGYKDLLGGQGRLLSDFAPQALQWFHGRYEKVELGPLDTLTATFSLNSQTDGSVRQGLKFSDPITRDHTGVRAYGYTAQATAHAGSRMFASLGGDVYDERIRSTREVRSPATGTATRTRPLYPDHSTYQNLGLFVQASYNFSTAWRADGGLRWSGVRFHTPADPVFSIPTSTQWFRDLTFHSSLRWQANQRLGFHGVVSRGFRAPNLNDLGALGLNDLGYEIPASAAIPAGAYLSTDAGEAATSKGAPLSPLRPESLLNYEFGARIIFPRLYWRVQLFDTELYDPIVRRTLLFPLGAAPAELAGVPVTALPPTAAQAAQGFLTVRTPADPRAVKAFVNDGRARYYGLENIVRYSLHSRWAVEGNYSYILGRDLNPNRNIRRLPPQMGSAVVRYIPPGRRLWFEISAAAAGRQNRLSGGDRDDERIGAAFRRRDIADFFEGARVEPYRAGGVFVPTGETLSQIQNRVLPIGSVVNGVLVTSDNTRVPLYLSTAGWATFSIRSGIPLGERWRIQAALENLLDRNYRVHGSGIDSPGRNFYLGISYRF